MYKKMQPNFQRRKGIFLHNYVKCTYKKDKMYVPKTNDMHKDLHHGHIVLRLRFKSQ